MPEPWTASLFPAYSTGPVERDGHTLWLAYWLNVQPADRVYLIFESVVGSNRQGVRVSFDRYFHAMSDGQDEGRAFVLWSDAGPRVRDLEMVRIHGEATLNITNCWNDGRRPGAQIAAGASWLEAIPQADGSILLNASDGSTPVGQPSMVVRVIHERARQLQRAT